MIRMFSHQKLSVYRKAMMLVADLGQLATDWDKRHSVVDHLARAAESMVMNLAEAARLRSTPAKESTMDYAIGSALECAACLDIAMVKEFLELTTGFRVKERLCEIVRMLTGLRKSWSSLALHEEFPQPNSPFLFGHERLMVYCTALDFIAWFHRLPCGRELSHRLHRQLDKTATSMLLNIAEGNGRRTPDDRRKFVSIAESAIVKAAVYLELCQHKHSLPQAQFQSGLARLDRVAQLLHGFV